MPHTIRFFDANGNEIASREAHYENSDTAHEAYDDAVAKINHGDLGNAIKVTFDGNRKQHAVPSKDGTVERVEAEYAEDHPKALSADEQRTEDDKQARADFRESIVVPEEIRNPDAGTLPPHDPNPPKPEVVRVVKPVKPVKADPSPAPKVEPVERARAESSFGQAPKTVDRGGAFPERGFDSSEPRPKKSN